MQFEKRFRLFMLASFVLCGAATARAQGIVNYCFGTASACPCGNAGGAGAGCQNSFGTGSTLNATGTAQISNDTVTLTVTGLPTGTTIVYFQGTAKVNSGLGTAFGDGLLCVGGTVLRLAARTANGTTSALGQGVGSDQPISVLGELPPDGGRIYYQGWYRNAASFCTPDGFNLTNAVAIQWQP